MELRTENILNDLLDRYEHSKLSMGGSERKIRVRFVMRRDLPEYYSIENYASARQLDENLDYFESLGWIVVHREDELVESIDLNPAYVQDISKRLERSLRSDRNAILKGLLESYRLQGIDEYIEAVIKRLDAYQSVKSLTFEEMPDQELFLKALSSIMTLKEDVYERVYSARHLGTLSEHLSFVLKTSRMVLRLPLRILKK